MLLQVALNGSRTQKEHPGIPITAEQLASEASQAVAAGAHAIHLHVHALDGNESLASEDVARTLQAVREKCPRIPVGISTSASIVANPTDRYRLVSAWTALPDYVSVNVHEEGAFQLIQLLITKDIGIEAGVWSAASAEWLIKSRILASCLRILIEAPGLTIPDAVETVDAIEAILDRSDLQKPRLLHGENNSAWPMIHRAIKSGYDTRAGMEDMLTLPDGTIANNNAEIVRAVGMLADHDFSEGNSQ